MSDDAAPSRDESRSMEAARLEEARGVLVVESTRLTRELVGIVGEEKRNKSREDFLPILATPSVHIPDSLHWGVEPVKVAEIREHYRVHSGDLSTLSRMSI